MKVHRDKSGNAVVVLTFDELGIIRYSLAEAVDRFSFTAGWMAKMGYAEAANAQKTSDRAAKARDGLEKATQKFIARRQYKKAKILEVEQ